MCGSHQESIEELPPELKAGFISDLIILQLRINSRVPQNSPLDSSEFDWAQLGMTPRMVYMPYTHV